MAAEALVGLLTLFALCCFFAGPWQSVWTDWYRQFVFEKRDELFDMARRGEISFEDPAYRATRSLFEQSIRFAHSMSLSQFLVLLIRSWNKEEVEPSAAELSLRHVASAEVRAKIHAGREEMIKFMIAIMVLRSPLGLLILLPLAAMATLFKKKPLEDVRGVVEHDIELMAA